MLLQYHRVFAEAGAQYGHLLRATSNQSPVPQLSQLAFRPSDLSFVAGVEFQDSLGVSVGWRYASNWLARLTWPCYVGLFSNRAR